MMTRVHGLIGYLAHRTWCGRADVNCMVTHDPYDSIVDCKTCLRVRTYWLLEKGKDEARVQSRPDDVT